MLAAVSGKAHAASAVNLDSEPRTLIVTEGGSKTELALGAGETVEFCPAGCFVTHAERRPRSADRLRDDRDLRRRRPRSSSRRSCRLRRPGELSGLLSFSGKPIG